MTKYAPHMHLIIIKIVIIIIKIVIITIKIVIIIIIIISIVITKSRIIKRVLLKNVMHDVRFPTFQKKNFTYKTRYGEQCFNIPFVWIF